MKKVLGSMMALVLLFCACLMPASAAGGSLAAQDTSAVIGGSFQISVSVQDNPGVIALTVAAEYDSKVLELTKVENGKVFPNILVTSQFLNVNPYKVTWMEALAPENITTNGVLATYTFRVLNKAAAGNTKIKFFVDDSVRVDKSKASIAGSTATVKLKAGDPAASGDKTVSNTGDAQPAAPESAVQNSAGAEPQEGDSRMDSGTTSDTDLQSAGKTSPTGDTKSEKEKSPFPVWMIGALGVIVAAAAVTAVVLRVRKKGAKTSEAETGTDGETDDTQS